MKTPRILLAIVTASLALTFSVQAATFNFDLLGQAGPGLIIGNEVPTVPASGGSGGEVGAGISYDDVLNYLTINVGWGSGMGFTDLTGTTTAGHIHGPTPSNAPGSFSEAVSPLITLHTLPGWNSSATNGGFSGTLILTEEQESFLFDGRLYFNAHTSANPGGEIRGNLVPEPATIGLFALGAVGVLLLARRRA
jgi:hypothetical protein